jgi:hypothetical protein
MKKISFWREWRIPDGGEFFRKKSILQFARAPNRVYSTAMKKGLENLNQTSKQEKET